MKTFRTIFITLILTAMAVACGDSGNGGGGGGGGGTPPPGGGGDGGGDDGTLTGDWIFFETDRNGDWDIYKVRPDGTGLSPVISSAGTNEVKPVVDASNGYLYFVRGDVGAEYQEIVRSELDGSGQTVITDAAAGGGNYLSGKSRPALAPDGSKIVYNIAMSAFENFEIFIMDADGANITRLTNTSVNNSMPTTDGTYIFFHSGTIGSAFSCDLYKMDMDGSNQALLHDSGTGDQSPVLSRDLSKLSWVRLSSTERSLRLINPDGTGDASVLTSTTDHIMRNQSWSPGGDKLAYSNRVGGAANFDIYIINEDGTGETQVTDDGFTNNAPWWYRAP